MRTDFEGASCWCGNTILTPFSPEYVKCERCMTLVVRKMPAATDLLVDDDESDFYGRRYYETHLIDRYGYPTLAERERTDLIERGPHWLRALLRYQSPPAKVLELGSAHGGFVALMRWSGFDATGLELSPSLVERAREVFDVPILTGPIEDQQVEPASLDAIVLMDVLEHLRDPVGTLQQCAGLLKPGGFFLVQTPEYREDTDYEELVNRNDPFLAQLKAQEHLYLTSRRAAIDLFARVGFSCVSFEPAVFCQYDMFFVASRHVLKTHTSDEIARDLTATPSGRLVLAVLDLHSAVTEYRDRSLPEMRTAAEARLMAVNELTAANTSLKQQVESLAMAAEERLRAADDRLQALHDADHNLRAAYGRITELEHAADDRLQALRDADHKLRAAYGRIAELERTQSEQAEARQRQHESLDESQRLAAALNDALVRLQSEYDSVEQEILALRKETLIGFFVRRYLRKNSAFK